MKTFDPNRMKSSILGRVKKPKMDMGEATKGTSPSQSVTQTRGQTSVMGKCQNWKRPNRKFGFRIEVRSVKRIDESSFCRNILVLNSRVSYNFVVLAEKA